MKTIAIQRNFKSKTWKIELRETPNGFSVYIDWKSNNQILLSKWIVSVIISIKWKEEISKYLDEIENSSLSDVSWFITAKAEKLTSFDWDF